MMPRATAHSDGLLFHNLTSCEDTSDASDLKWVTEVVQKAHGKVIPVQDTHIPNHSEDEDLDSTSRRQSKKPARGRGDGLSFINVSGAPTKESRKEARKATTTSRKLEKKKILEVAKRGGVLLSATGSQVAPSSRPSQDFSVFSLAHISRFAASRSDPFMIYPFELTHREKRLLDHIFYVESEAIKPYKECIFPLGLTDVAAFHQVLANFAIQLDSHRLPGQETEKAIEYERYEVETRHNAALRITQNRLMNPQEAISDGTIATIITMICYSHLTRDFTAWHSHIKGLREILKLQNQLRHPGEIISVDSGFQSLDAILRQSIAWVDVNGSGTQDLRPYFPFVSRENNTDLMKPKPQTKAFLIANELSLVFPSGQQMFSMFSDTATFAEELRAQLLKRSNKLYEDSTWSLEHLYPLIHKLYSYRGSLDTDDVESVLKECCRLALCIFLTHIRAKFGFSAEVLEIYVEQLLPLVRNVKFKTEYGKEHSSFRMWILVMGAMEGRGETRAAFVDILKSELRDLGILTHVDLEEALMDIIWVGEIDGERFWKLYGALWITEGSAPRPV